MFRERVWKERRRKSIETEESAYMCIEDESEEIETRRWGHEGSRQRAPPRYQGGVVRVKPGSPWFPWIPGEYLQRGSTARMEREEDAGSWGGQTEKERREAACHRPRIFWCIASPFSAYLNDTIVLYERSDIGTWRAEWGPARLSSPDLAAIVAASSTAERSVALSPLRFPSHRFRSGTSAL